MTAEAVVVNGALTVLAVGFVLALVRTALGPTRADRVVGADLAFFLLVGGLGLIGVRQQAPAYLDVVLVMAVVGFLSTVVLSRLIGRGPR